MFKMIVAAVIFFGLVVNSFPGDGGGDVETPVKMPKIFMTTYPNPVSKGKNNKVLMVMKNITSDNNIVSVRVFDIMGRQTQVIAIDNLRIRSINLLELDVAELSVGIYFVRIEVTSGSAHQFVSKKVSVLP